MYRYILLLVVLLSASTYSTAQAPCAQSGQIADSVPCCEGMVKYIPPGYTNRKPICVYPNEVNELNAKFKESRSWERPMFYFALLIGIVLFVIAFRLRKKRLQ